MGYFKVEDFIKILNKIEEDKMIYCYVPLQGAENLSPICGIEEHDKVVELKYNKVDYDESLVQAPSMSLKSLVKILGEVKQDKYIVYKIKDNLEPLDPLIGISEYPELIELQFNMSEIK